MKTFSVYILSILLLFSFQTGFGQSNSFETGFEAGPSLIFLRGNETIRSFQKPALGMAVGTFLQFNFDKTYSLRASISYERKGSRTVFDINDAVDNYIDKVRIGTNYDYITLPLLYRVTGGKKLRYFVNAGPYVGLLMQQTFVTKSKLSPTIAEDNTASNRRFDFGFSSGFGLSIPIQPTFGLSFELRNNLGLSNVNAVPIRNNGKILTNATNLLIGFSFGLGDGKE